MMAYLSYLITRGFMAVFGWLPFPVLYAFSDLLAAVFIRFGYRNKVVMSNLRRCFPDMPEDELNRIAKASYRNLCDVTLESVKGVTMSRSAIQKRFVYPSYGLPNRLLKNGQPILLVGGHYNNWEWGVLTIAEKFDGTSFGVYKPLSNKHVNNWYTGSRNRDPKMILTPMRETFAAVKANLHEPAVFILVADQSPSNRETAQWVNFFGQPTACAPGPDVIARTNNMPTLMYHTRRIRRGHYEMDFSLLHENPAELPPGGITELFMNRLEADIKKDPGNWLWSHKRWKIPAPVAAV
ncbi:MAG: lysophospholipid acyltransferase family protein [Saprospiraceae bacterium]|nr:lysophospholipid acyltransferase family protein [Saprospiraceae bacterium]